MVDIEQLTRLRQLLATRFSDGELRTLCFDLGVDYDDLPGQGKSDKARELLTYMDQHDRLADLVRMGRDSRPDVPWPVIGRAQVNQPSTLNTVRRETIETRLAALAEEYTAANRQLGYTLSEVDRLRIKRQIEALDAEMKALTIELNTLE